MDIVGNFKKKIEHIFSSLKEEFGKIRTNRPVTGLVENIKLEYYGQTVPIKQVGSISVQPPRDIVIQVWDKGAIQGVVKAIENASLGVSASAEEASVRVHLPELSGERREELIKHVKRILEDHRIQVRHVRDEANKEAQKESDEDEKFRLKEAIQEETEKINKEMEELLEKKTKEIQL